LKKKLVCIELIKECGENKLTNYDEAIFLIDELKNEGLVGLRQGFSTKYIGKWQSQMVNLFL